jgi:tRNA U34 2-thiouridine synthase MnmA/TrmU
VELRFPEPAGQVSPGQAVVLYRGDEVLGGGVVEAAA